MDSCCDGLSCILDIKPLGTDQGVDIFFTQNRSEYDYMQAVVGVSQRLLNSWKGVNSVRQIVNKLPHSLLRMDLRYTSKWSDLWTV